MSDLTNLLKNFNFATVMNVCVVKLSDMQYGKQLTPEDFSEHVCFLDTLKIANITETGPKKEFKTGLNNFPAIRYGKAVTLDMHDALGKVETLKNFFGFKETQSGSLYSSDHFAEPIALLGQVKVINTEMVNTDLWIFIPCLVPKGVLTITQDAEGEFGVFDLGGTLYPVNFATFEDGIHQEYYSFHKTDPLDTTINYTDEVVVYSELTKAIEAIRVGDTVHIFDGTQSASSEN